MSIHDITVFLTKLDPHIEEWAAITTWSEGAVWMLVVGLAIAVVAFPLLTFAGIVIMPSGSRSHCHECAVIEREQVARFFRWMGRGFRWVGRRAWRGPRSAPQTP